MERKGLGKKVTGTRFLCTFLRRRASGFFGTPPWLRLNCLGIPIASLSNENADVPDVKNSNRKFAVYVSHNKSQCLTVRIFRVKALKERKYQLPVAVFDVRDVKALVA